jgi:hypothetical protein
VSIKIDRDVFSADTDEQGRFTLRNVPLGTHALLARSLITTETRSYALTNLTLAAPGTASPITNVLRGVGVVSGQVFRSDGVTPAAGAELQLSFPDAPRVNSFSIFGNDAPTTFTDPNGAYRFVNVPIGAYELRASQLALVDYATGTNEFDGQSHEVNLTLSPSGSVKGHLVRADGSDQRLRVDVVATFASQTSFAGRSTARTDTDGNFELANIPVGDFALGAVVPVLNGIVLQKLAITSNGQVLDLGEVRLDEDDPSVEKVVPASGAAEVPINTTIELTFSEPLDVGSVKTNGIFLRSPTNFVAASVELLPDPLDGRRRLVRLRPTVSLKSETTYEIVALSGERQNALGKLVKAGPTDLVGRPLLATFTSMFTTKDNDPPFLTSLTPAINAIQIDPRAVIRLEYNEPLRNSGYLITVRGPAGVVIGTNDIGPNLRLLTFTPNAALSPNTAYSVTVEGVRDLAGNLAQNHPFTSVFNTLDTLGPEISTLRFANNAAPVAGASLQLESLLAASEPGVQVRYTADVNASGINVIGTGTIPPYRINTTLPTAGRVVFRATAIDQFGNEGPIKQFAISVVSNRPPSIVLERDTPATGPLRSGQAFTLLVDATDDVGVTNISLVSTGSFVFGTNFSNGGFIDLKLPPDAPPGPVQFQAQATDSLGAKSPIATLDFQIVDETPPTLTFLSPANNATLNPNQPLSIDVASSDNSTNIEFTLELTGALTLTQRVSVAVAPNVPVTNTFTISLGGIPQTGSSINALVRAMDGSSNFVSVTRTFLLPDITAPRLISVTPTNAAPRQSLWPSGLYQFSEAVAGGTVTTNRLFLTTGAGTVVPSRLTIGFAGTGVLVTPTELPLSPGATYRNVLLPGITDVAGNALLDFNGTEITAAGEIFSFTTAKILQITPTNNTPVIAGQVVVMTVSFESGLGASSFRFTLNNDPPVQVFLPAAATNVTGRLTIPATATQGTISIQASDSAGSAAPYVLPALTLNVRPRTADDDGDGLSNGYEIDSNLNPFAKDAAQDPDGDGLSNVQEFQLGTDPRNSDTDSDGLNDGAEIAARNCLDPLNPDSDGDGLLDGLDPDPCGGAGTGVALVVETIVIMSEGEQTNLVVRASSTSSRLVVLDFAPTNPPPLFASLGAVQFTNTPTNGLAVAELSLNPSYQDAGSYTITLRATSANNATGTTNITVTVRDNPALVTTRWKDPVNGNWNDSTRWSSGVPDGNKVAVIDFDGTYTVTVNANANAAGLTLGGSSGAQHLLLNGNNLTLDGASVVRGSGVLDFTSGTLQGSGVLSVASVLNWTAGTMQGAGRTVISSAGQLNLNGAGIKWLYRRLDSSGTNDWTGTGDLILVNGEFNNLAGASFQAHGGAQIRWNGGINAFNNAGIFLKTGSEPMSFASVPFNNTGTLNLNEGTLSFNGGGTNSSAILVSAGTSLSFASNYELAAGSVLSGAGTVNFNSGSIVATGVVDITGDLFLNNATVKFNAGQSLKRLHFSGGGLGGSGG